MSNNFKLDSELSSLHGSQGKRGFEIRLQHNNDIVELTERIANADLGFAIGKTVSPRVANIQPLT